MAISKKEIDEALSAKNYPKFKQLLQDLSVNALLSVVQEKQRFKCLIKKQDLTFINQVFKHIDDTNESDKYKHKGLIEDVWTISTSTEFTFKTKFHSPQDNNHKAFINLSQGLKELKIDSFKHKTMCCVLTEKLNADKDFMEKIISIIVNHKLIDETLVSRLGITALQSDFQSLNNYIVNSGILANEKLKRYYFDYVFTHTQNINHLDYLMDNFGETLREIFFEKADNNDFWTDFKHKFGGVQHGSDYSPIGQIVVREPNIEKLIWLEKNHMGYSNVEFPFFINFFKHLSVEQTEQILESVNSHKYLDMFNKSIADFEQLPEEFRTGPFWQKIGQHTDDPKTLLLKQFNYTGTGNSYSEEDFYGEMKKLTLKLNLSMSLQNKETPVRSRKI